MGAASAALIAVDVLALFAILLLLALRGLSFGQALGWMWDKFAHPVEAFRKAKRGEF